MISLKSVLHTLSLPARDTDLFFDHLCNDTRQWTPQALFIMMPGQAHPYHDIVSQLLPCAPRAVVTEDNPSIAALSCLLLKVPDIKKALDALCPLFYPSLSLHRWAVTGTNGKTSVCHFLFQLWQMSRIKSAAIGTLGICSYPALLWDQITLTSPSGLHLYQILAHCAREQIQHIIFEASSHALDQDRLRPLKVKGSIFTSFSRDHLDYHGDLNSYFLAKCRLFTHYTEKYAIFSNQLPHQDHLCTINPALTIGYYGPHAQAVPGYHNATYRILDKTERGQEVYFRINEHQWKSFIPLVGEFQISNLLAALYAFHLDGGSLSQVIPLLSRLQTIKGRMELIDSFAQGNIYVDYAHTPDALQKALAHLRPHVFGKLGLVFGCGGERDQGKRALMGKIAQEYADWVIVSDDNPRQENSAFIRQNILAHCPKGIEIVPRQKAIWHGMQRLSPGDTLLIAGKGHENIQRVGNQNVPFSDQDWVRSYPAQRASL